MVLIGRSIARAFWRANTCRKPLSLFTTKYFCKLPFFMIKANSFITSSESFYFTYGGKHIGCMGRSWYRPDSCCKLESSYF